MGSRLALRERQTRGATTSGERRERGEREGKERHTRGIVRVGKGGRGRNKR